MSAINNTLQWNLQEGWWQVLDFSSAHDTATHLVAAQALQMPAVLQHVSKYTALFYLLFATDKVQIKANQNNADTTKNWHAHMQSNITHRQFDEAVDRSWCVQAVTDQQTTPAMFSPSTLAHSHLQQVNTLLHIFVHMINKNKLDTPSVSWVTAFCPKIRCHYAYLISHPVVLKENFTLMATVQGY